MFKYKLMQMMLIERFFLLGYRWFQWISRDFSGGLPQPVKESVFKRYYISGAPWIETGTYIGTSTRFLSALSHQVYSLEPSPQFFQLATDRFKGSQGVTVIFGSSEDKLEEILSEISGPVNFWLDGHYSAGETFKGASDCPVVLELETIKKHLPQLGKVCIMIDDATHFGSRLSIDKDYPTLDYLVDWAREQKLNWRIDSDIVIIGGNN